MMLNLEGFPRYGAPTHLLRMLSCLSLLCMCGLSLCPFSGLVWDLLLRSRSAQPDGALPEEYSTFYHEDKMLSFWGGGSTPDPYVL